jgi:hypothetical protein
MSSAQRLSDEEDFECGPVTDANKEVTLEPLLAAVEFLGAWKKNLADATLGLSKSQQDLHFFPSETWDDFQSCTVGIMCACYAILGDNPDMSLFLRKFCSDVIEHHFGNTRQAGGATRMPVASACTRAANVAAQARQATGGRKGKSSGKRNCQGGGSAWQRDSSTVIPVQREQDQLGAFSMFCL